MITVSPDFDPKGGRRVRREDKKRERFFPSCEPQ